MIPIKVIPETSITMKIIIMEVDPDPSWMHKIVDYLQNDKLSEERDQTTRVRYHGKKFLVYNGKLYKRGISTPFSVAWPFQSPKKSSRRFTMGSVIILMGEISRLQSSTIRILLANYKDGHNWLHKEEWQMLEVTYIKAHLKLLTIVFFQWPFSK